MCFPSKWLAQEGPPPTPQNFQNCSAFNKMAKMEHFAGWKLKLGPQIQISRCQVWGPLTQLPGPPLNAKCTYISQWSNVFQNKLRHRSFFLFIETRKKNCGSNWKSKIEKFYILVFFCCFTGQRVWIMRESREKSRTNVHQRLSLQFKRHALWGFLFDCSHSSKEFGPDGPQIET